MASESHGIDPRARESQATDRKLESGRARDGQCVDTSSAQYARTPLVRIDALSSARFSIRLKTISSTLLRVTAMESRLIGITDALNRGAAPAPDRSHLFAGKGSEIHNAARDGSIARKPDIPRAGLQPSRTLGGLGYSTITNSTPIRFAMRARSPRPLRATHRSLGL